MRPTVITRGELLILIVSHVAKGATFVSFSATVDAKLKKTGNGFAMPVFKTSEVNGVLGYKYESAVNRQQKREGGEGDFEAQERSWGTRLNNGLVEHNGKHYMTIKVERSLSNPVYRDSNGNTLSEEQVSPFLPSKKSNAGHQGVEKEIIHRDYSLESINNISIGGNVYQVVD